MAQVMLRNVEETMRGDADFIKYLAPSSVVLGNDFVGPLSEVAGASSAMYCPPCSHPLKHAFSFSR
jgi:hypothetical protein